MKRFLWGAAYVLTFVLAFVGGIVWAARPSAGLGGFENVEWTKASGRVERDIAYGPGPAQKYDLYLPGDSARATKLVVYIHAGGFRTGDKADDEQIAKWFASRGYVVATVNYTLSAEGNQANVMSMSHEIRRGVASAVEGARRRGYAVDAMAIGGGSAGGALAMIYAYRDAEQAPVPVRAVINLVGPASFDPVAWFEINDGFASDESAQGGAAFVSMMTGETVSLEEMRSGDYHRILRPITATALVTADAPPSLLAFGALDKVAPFAASSDLEAALQRNRVPHDVFVFPRSGHGLNRAPAMSKALNAKIGEYLDRYLPLG